MRNGKAIFAGFPDEVLAKITEEEQKEMLGIRIKGSYREIGLRAHL